MPLGVPDSRTAFPGVAVEDTGQRRWADTTFRFAGDGTADLAYGATAHTKQGKTVTAAIPLVTGSEPPNGSTRP